MWDNDGFTPKVQSGTVIPMFASGELNPPKKGVYLSILGRVSVYRLSWPFKWYASKGEQEPRKFLWNMLIVFVQRFLFNKKN